MSNIISGLLRQYNDSLVKSRYSNDDKKSLVCSMNPKTRMELLYHMENSEKWYYQIKENNTHYIFGMKIIFDSSLEDLEFKIYVDLSKVKKYEL